ncbi:MAG: acyltransferase family protein, partial [Novosphingobium sp.]
CTLSVVSFLSNVLFWRGDGYFSDNGNRPLLHTWSLAVEEQFYIIFPLLLWLLLRNGRKVLGAVLWLVLLASLALSIIGTYQFPSATFFLLPARASELLLGAVISAGLVPELRRPGLCIGLALAGLAMIVWSVVTYDAQIAFPGLAALPPCLGAAFILAAGRNVTAWPSRMLGAPLLVGFGLISYSLYLAHFPLLNYAHAASSPQNLTALRGIALAASVALAYGSWRWVERPFRDAKRFSQKAIFVMAGGGSLAVATLAGAILLLHGAPQRFDQTSLQLAASANDFDAASRACVDLPLGTLFAGTQCRINADPKTPTSADPDFILWGDSHAAALSAALAAPAKLRGWQGLLVSTTACPPLLDYRSTALAAKASAACIASNRDLAARISASPAIKTVVLAGFWGAYQQQVDKAGDPAVLGKALARTLDALNGKNVVILLDTPTADRLLPAALALDRHWGRSINWMTPNTNSAASQSIRRIAKGRARIIDLSALFCAPGRPCSPVADGKAVLSDGNHLSKSVAAAVVAPYLVKNRIF